MGGGRGERRCVICIRGGEVCGKKRGVMCIGGLEMCVGRRGVICIGVDMSVGSRCGEGNNRREEMTREEKRCGEEGDGLMDLMDGLY